MINKKSQSQIISSVLLILLVIAAVMIVMQIVIPLIKNKLSGAECLDIVGKIQIKNNPAYTCYNPATSNMSVQIHMGDTSNLTKGFQINTEFGGGSKTVEVIPGTSDEVYMYSGGVVEIPGRNEERTYIITGINSLPDSISVYPILNDGKTCDASDILNSVVSC